jgi:carbonic anhydrase/SulP family sulfate permease
VVGAISLLLLALWDRSAWLKKSPVPAPLVVVVLGVSLSYFFRQLGAPWSIESAHMVQVPIFQGDWSKFIITPDFQQLVNPAIYTAAVTIAIAASLETLLNVEAVDKLDPERRVTPTNRELVAQGVGNIAAGLLGGLPMTSVVVRSSVNVQAGGKTNLSAVTHGVLLLACVALIPGVLNEIPLPALAAILLMTGLKLASPKLVKQMWAEGASQFLPFVITVVAIVFTDLLIGILIGLGVSVLFILHSNFRRPIHRVLEHHVSGDVMRIELANQVSFLNRAALERALHEVAPGEHVLLDASTTDYIDPDVLDLIEDFRLTGAKARGVEVSLKGFRKEYNLKDDIQFQDFTTREVQSALTPDRVIKLLREGNSRFQRGERIARDLRRQVDLTALSQHPMAVILSCIDSRSPAEMVFDVGLGDVFSVRIAGNVAKEKVLGSLEYACQVAGAKLVLVLGHTSCGAVNAAVDLFGGSETPEEATGCDHLDALMDYLQRSVDPVKRDKALSIGPEAKRAYADELARANVERTVNLVRKESKVLGRLEREGRIKIIGGMYSLSSGVAELFEVTPAVSTAAEGVKTESR